MAALSGIKAFRGIDPVELDRIESRSRTIEPRDGTRVFAQGDAADAVYAIVAGEGHVRIGTIDRTSKGLMIAVSGAGDMFGEVAVIDGSTRTADAVVEGRVRLLRISAGMFMEALETHPALGATLCRIFASQMRRNSELLLDATFESLEVRLARQVLYLARREGRRTEQGVQLAGRFRQGDLADLLGATTRSIITILNVWRAAGYVIYDPARAQLTVCDDAGLQAFAGNARERELRHDHPA